MNAPADLDQLTPEQLRELATHEMATLKRLKFAAASEAYTGKRQQLLFETIEADLEALAAEIEKLALTAPAEREKQQPKRIGEDIAEKLDYQPGVFTVERHVCGKWECRQCETLVQAPVPAHVIDKGIPTAGLLAQVLVAKYSDHLPLYRQEGIFGRAGLAIPASTLAHWIGACGVQLQPLVDTLTDELLAYPDFFVKWPTTGWTNTIAFLRGPPVSGIARGSRP
jgi:transposase